jgi:hypothetical protein
VHTTACCPRIHRDGCLSRTWAEPRPRGPIQSSPLVDMGRMELREVERTRPHARLTQLGSGRRPTAVSLSQVVSILPDTAHPFELKRPGTHHVSHDQPYSWERTVSAGIGTARHPWWGGSHPDLSSNHSTSSMPRHAGSPKEQSNGTYSFLHSPPDPAHPISFVESCLSRPQDRKKFAQETPVSPCNFGSLPRWHLARI